MTDDANTIAERIAIRAEKLAQEALGVANKALTKIDQHQETCIELQRTSATERKEINHKIDRLDADTRTRDNETHARINKLGRSIWYLVISIAGAIIVGLFAIIRDLLYKGAPWGPFGG